MVLVCSPETGIVKLSTVGTQREITNAAHVKRRLSRPKLARKCVEVASRVGSPNSTSYRWEYYSPRHKLGLRTSRRQPPLQSSKTGGFGVYVKALPLIPLTITYATLSPRAGAEPWVVNQGLSGLFLLKL